MKQHVFSKRSAGRLVALLLVAVLLVSGLTFLALADGERVTITRLEWLNTESQVYGQAKTVAVVAYDEEGNAYPDAYTVKYPAGYGEVNDEGYTLTAVLKSSAAASFDEAEDLVLTETVFIAPKQYGVFMEDLTVAGTGFTPYMISVTGVDTEGNEMPFEVKSMISYTVNGKEFNGTAEFGTYNIVAALPTGNYVFYSGNHVVTKMSATLTVNREMDVVDVLDDAGETAFSVFLSSSVSPDGTQNGLDAKVSATATVATGLKMPSGTRHAQAFQIILHNATEEEYYSLIVPLTDDVYQEGCGVINPKTSVYIFDTDGNPVTAKSLGFASSAGRGYVKISGIAGSIGTLTVLIAPQYSDGGLGWGWILFIILLIIILLLIIMYFVGRKIYRNMKKEEPQPEEPTEEPAVEAYAPVAEEPAPVVVTEEGGADPTLPTMRGLVYIDVVKKPEEYGEMLMKEKAGEGVIVYRYRKSYLAKLALADGKIGEYYSVIKNALLRFRGVKARKSWNYEAFNQGRNQIARVIPNGKTLYLYLSIDPKTLEGTKYGAIDVSDKKKFEATPALMKIRGDRKLKFALELIEKICGEILQLKPTDKPEENYKPANQSAEKLMDNGMIRKMAALAPLPEKEEE